MDILFSLVYVSSATRPLSAAELELILQESRMRNTGNAVTGILIHSDGNFMQMLEGPRQSLDDTMARVRASRRHSGIIELIDEPVTVREFESWSMAYSPADAQQFVQLTTAPWVRSTDHLSGGRELLRQFSQNAGLRGGT
jgi:hypothetical protein